MVRRLLSLYATPATLVGVRLSGALAAFLTSLVLARTMDQADMGQALTFVSLAILLGIVPTAGIEAGAVRFIARYRQSGEHAKARGFLRLTRQVVTASSAAILLLTAALFIGMLVDWHQAVILVFIAACVTAALRVGAAHALAFDKVVRSQLPLTFLRQLGFLLALLFCVMLVEKPGVPLVVGAFLVASVLALLVQAVLLRGIGSSLGTGASDTSDWKEWALYGLQMAPTQTFVQYSRDLVLIIAAWSLAPENIAILAVATALVAFVKFGVAAINQSIAPRMAALIAAEDKGALRRLIDVSNHMKFWPVLLAFVAFALAGRSILGLFGQGFVDATPILLILMLEPLALAVFGPAGQYISLSGQQAVLIPFAVIAILIMCLAVTAGAWIGDLPGAALGVGVTWWIWCMMTAQFTRQKSNMNVTIFATLSAALLGPRT